MEQDAYNGNDRKNPFYFETAGMKEAALIVNGVWTISPLHLWRGSGWERSVFQFSWKYRNIIIWDGSFDEFKNGYFILPFDCSLSKDNGLYTHKTEGGSPTVKVKSKKLLMKRL